MAPAQPCGRHVLARALTVRAAAPLGSGVPAILVSSIPETKRSPAAFALGQWFGVC